MTTATAELQTKKKDWRSFVFRVIGGLISLFFLAISIYGLLWPWVIVLPEFADPESQRWYAAQWGVLGTFFFAMPLMFTVINPRKSVSTMQYWVLGVLISSIIWFVFGEKDLSSFVILGVVLITYPNLGALLKFGIPSPRRTLAIIGGAVILGLMPRLVSDFQMVMSLSGGSLEELMVLDNYTHEISIILYIIIGLGWAAFLRSGGKVIGAIVGCSLAYMGIAAFFIPNHPGSWGLLGGALSLLAGIAYLVALRLEFKKGAAEG